MGKKSSRRRTLEWTVRKLFASLATAIGASQFAGLIRKCDVPQGIPDDHVVWRQAADSENNRIYDGDEGRYKLRADNETLQFDPDLSVYWREHLALHKMGHEALITAFPARTLIFEATVRSLRALHPLSEDKRVHVVYTPMSAKPIDCAHSSVLPMGLPTGKGGSSERKLVREDFKSAFVLNPSTPISEVPEGA